MNTKNAETSGSAAVRRYLEAVEREASALPADRRQELVADIAEHIEIARAERPGELQDILREVGDPRVIAAAALQESGTGTGETPGRRSPAWVPLLLMLLKFALWWNFWLLMLSTVLEVAGVVVLCRSRHWTARQKWLGATSIVVVPQLTLVVTNLVFGHATPPLYWGVAMVMLMAVMPLGAAGWLWLTRKR
ncbi:HAAS signaling domain-containing protein [Streptomyces sp. WMMC940]|uniref:HAAS signaling domain-containing protein n=1 Tax=Streptomyces sp. WMMC940 TaxID=3015153 RepID=UPI0022B72091|nr:hypothetical protein [Streptomyces sp. WMMC940]MCZ7459894.1 hypothetical protein [Streptomyces sp. WMMC940]